jgi:lysophospholipase L1-like esterase
VSFFSRPLIRLLAAAAILLHGAGVLASDLVRDLAAGRPRKVVVYGTSLTASGPWVGLMQSWLTANYSGTLTIVNSGLSGKNSADGVAQLSSKVLAHNPDTVFLEFAVNDAFLYAETDPSPQLSVTQARANLVSMIDAIRQQNPKAEIILQTMNSVWDSPSGSNASATLRPNLPAYYQMYRDVAAERGLLLIDHYPNWVALQTNNLATYQADVPDGVHPNAAGTQLITMPLLQRRLIGDIRYHPADAPSPTLLAADVCIYGGSSGAVAAAVQAARLGKRVVLLSPDTWLGGLSSNGLGWTDLGDPAAIGGLAREFYTRIYNYYLNDSVWTRETRAAYLSRSSIDPDDAQKVMFTFEPKVARQIFEDMIAEAGVTVVRARLKRTPGGVQKTGKIIREIMTDDGKTSIRAAMFIDATYEGDLLAAAGVSYAVGREANSIYTETLNGIQTANVGGNQLPNGVDPYVTAGQPASGLLPGVNASSGGADGTGDQRLQAYTFRMCLTDVAANRLPVPQPAGYQESDYELLFRAITAGQTSNFFKTSPMPNRKTDSNNSNGFSTDFIGGNYNLAEGWNYAEADYAKRDEILAAHLRYQQGFVWALQNSPNVPVSIRTSLASWGLPLDEFTETGRWPAQLYVREARRMVGDFVVTQRYVNQQTGFVATDPIGMGGYNMDSHHAQRHVTAGGIVKNEGDIQVGPAKGPYGISYRAIVPKAAEVENLLVPVCVSASHIAFGSIRMEPVFMILGQSAAIAAVRAINDGVPVQQVDYTALRRDLTLARQILSLNSPPVSGEIIVDNSDATGVTFTGDWTASTATAGYYGANYHHDGNIAQGTKSVRYTPTLPSAGTYEVFARWTVHTNRATNVRYDIVHAAGTTTAPLMNQQANNATWMSLGSYQFNTGTAGSVLVRNDAANGYVIADAVRFVPANAAPACSIVAPIPATEETSSTPGMFTVFRDVAGAADLNVQLNFAGTATAGTDYQSLSATVTIPAGRLSASLSVQAIPDNLVEGSETVIATIAANAAYNLGTSTSATVTIFDPPFDRWKAAHFSAPELADPQVSGDAADFDRDGRGTFLEYATGRDPHVTDVSATPFAVWINGPGGAQLRLYYDKSGADLRYEVEQSSTIPLGWTHTGVGPELYDPANGLFYQAASIAPADPAKFLHLKILRP